MRVFHEDEYTEMGITSLEKGNLYALLNNHTTSPHKT